MKQGVVFFALPFFMENMMSYIPIGFVDDTEPYIEANNLNHMQQGILIGVDRSREAKEIADNLNQLYLNGALKGEKGDKGDKGEDGANFKVDGEVAMLSDLPDPTLHAGEIWLTNEYGHLHKSTGTEWLDWGQFTGIKGDKGDKGDDGVFDISTLTYQELQQLHEKLLPFDDHQFWSYETFVDVGQTARFKVADLNLDLSISRVTTTINYRFYPNDTSKPSLYYVNRLSNYDAIAWESTYTTGWKAQAITESGFVLDASGYLAGREQTFIQVIDPENKMWYTIGFIGLGEGTMFIDVKKRVDSKRQIITAT